MSEPLAFPPGLLAAHQIARLVEHGCIGHDTPLAVTPASIQPASLDLRLGRRAWRVRASFLPGPNRSVRDCIAAQPSHPVDLSQPIVLETGTVTIVELDESL